MSFDAALQKLTSLGMSEEEAREFLLDIDREIYAATKRKLENEKTQRK